MKKKFLFILLSTSLAFSQNCKYKRDEVDEFTKATILETKEEALAISGMGMGFSSTYSLIKINGEKYFKLHLYYTKIFTLPKGSEIMFKTNGEPIVLKYPETVVAEGGYNSALKITHWKTNINIKLSEDDYNNLLNEKISKVRINTGDGYFDDDVKEKHDKKLKKSLVCIK